jgi:hypothetical protein
MTFSLSLSLTHSTTFGLAFQLPIENLDVSERDGIENNLRSITEVGDKHVE